MAKVTKKTPFKTIDGTPKKRLFLSIISDYDLKTSLCELVDNALDFWVVEGQKPGLTIEISLDTARQLIEVCDNAGGVSEEQADLLITPGASRNDTGNAIIGIFGVGGKRAGVALGEHIEIQTRRGKGKSLQVDLTKDWIQSHDWDLDLYAIPEISPSTTRVTISKVRQSFDSEDVGLIRTHLGETYSWFVEHGCRIVLNGQKIPSKTFDSWAFPQDFPPRQASFQIEPSAGRFLDVELTGGLIHDRDAEAENYGVYIYCNHRLIVKELRSRDVGYVSGEAGIPHPDASLCRVIVNFVGPAELMPWNSSKNGINFSHPALMQLRKRLIEFTSHYSGLSRRFKHQWDTEVFRHKEGCVVQIDAADILSDRKRVFPALPTTKQPTRFEEVKELNKSLLKDEPWTLGLIEAIGFVDLLGKQKFQTKNRVALILLDSNFEIALKEFIVHRKDLFPAHTYTNQKLATLFSRRTDVIKEVQNHAHFKPTLLKKVSHYYDMRNNLIHQRATVSVTDEEVEDYRKVIERVLRALFKIRFPAD